MQLTGDFKSSPKRNAAPHEETTIRHPYKWEKDENKNTNKQIKPSTAIFVEIRQLLWSSEKQTAGREETEWHTLEAMKLLNGTQISSRVCSYELMNETFHKANLSKKNCSNAVWNS